MKRKKFISIIAGLAIALSICIVSAVQMIVASPGNPQKNPGHSWDQMDCDSNLCVNTITGRVGIGTTMPTTGKLVVSGGNVDMTTNKIINLATPTAASDAATKGYVDAMSTGAILRTQCGWSTCGASSPTLGSCTPPACPSGWSDAGTGCWPTGVTSGLVESWTILCGSGSSYDQVWAMTVGTCYRNCIK